MDLATPRATAAALVFGALCAAGCAAPEQAQQEQAPTPSSTALAAAPGTVPEQLDDGSTAPPPTTSTLRADAKSQAAAVRAADEAMTLFARRAVSADRWWMELAPLLSARAAQDYRYTDPANVPATEVTGTGTVLPSQTARIGRVSVPTDAGVYLVVLSRTDTAPGWVVERFTPPEGEGD